MQVMNTVSFLRFYRYPDLTDLHKHLAIAAVNDILCVLGTGYHRSDGGWCKCVDYCPSVVHFLLRVLHESDETLTVSHASQAPRLCTLDIGTHEHAKRHYEA